MNESKNTTYENLQNIVQAENFIAINYVNKQERYIHT